MNSFFMFGKYTSGAVEKFAGDWVRQIMETVQMLGGEVQTMYALLGPYDLLVIVQFPTMEQALKASVNISQNLNISFSTMPAIPVEAFDRLIGS